MTLVIHNLPTRCCFQRAPILRCPRKESETQTLLRQLIRDDGGQDLIEYALLAGFIALASVAMITNIGTGTNSVYGAIAAVFDDACGGGSGGGFGRGGGLGCGAGGN